MCMWVDLDTLLRRCSVICRMYKRTSGEGMIVTTGIIKGAEVGFSNTESTT